jgi:hypothetical protein
MKWFVLALIFIGTALAQNKVVQGHPKWQLHESHDEIHGDSLSFILPSTEASVRSQSSGRIEKSAVYMGVICGKDGGIEVAYISFNIPLHIDHMYVGDSGRSESFTEIRYREGDEVASRLAVIEDDGSSVFTRSADWFKPFVGKAIEIEDVYGHIHVFHFPSVSLAPLEGDCKNYVEEVEAIGQDAICGVLQDRYSADMRKLAIGADQEARGNKYRSEFNSELKRDAAKNPKCGLATIKPIPLY